jgi:putative Mn2+ efflux pump MntP
MNILAILLIATGLAMDAFAVSIASGVLIKEVKMRNALTIAMLFGLFQAIMPVIGWLAGIGLGCLIAGFDHWFAFGLLTIIGLRMIYESFKLKSKKNKIDPLNILVLFTLAIATSIDALAVGLSLSFLKIAIAQPAVIIGIITFLFSFAGVYIGSKVGHFFEKKIEMAGGLILIGIGVKILIEHLA